MKLGNKSVLVTVFVLFGSYPTWALAEESQDFQAIIPSFLVEVSGGHGTHHAELAVGLESENQIGSFAGIYIADSSFGKDGGTLKEIGIKAFNFADVSTESYGAAMHLGISKTVLQQYSRRGMEVGVDIYAFFTDSLAVFIGSTLRPKFLSLDWDNDELFEVSSNVGLHYQLPYNINVFTQYQYDNFITGNWKFSRIGSYGMVGINWMY